MGWRYDETGSPKPPVTEAEMRRASNTIKHSFVRPAPKPGSSGPTETISEEVPASSRSARILTPPAAKPSAPAARVRVPTPPMAAAPRAARPPVAAAPSVRAARATTPPVASSSTPAVEYEKRDISAPEDLGTVRDLRAEVRRLASGLPSQQLQELEMKNARLEAEGERLRKRVEGYHLTMEQVLH